MSTLDMAMEQRPSQKYSQGPWRTMGKEVLPRSLTVSAQGDVMCASHFSLK